MMADWMAVSCVEWMVSQMVASWTKRMDVKKVGQRAESWTEGLAAMGAGWKAVSQVHCKRNVSNVVSNLEALTDKFGISDEPYSYQCQYW